MSPFYQHHREAGPSSCALDIPGSETASCMVRGERLLPKTNFVKFKEWLAVTKKKKGDWCATDIHVSESAPTFCTRDIFFGLEPR